MRIAALYDIHGNLPALEAVLEEIARADVDRIVIGGDVVPGPMPCETLQRLLALDRPADFLLGNGELAILAQIAAGETGEPEYWGTASGGPPPEPVREVCRWTARRLPPDDAEVMANWPKTVRFDIEGLGPTLFCHGTPRSETEIFTKLTPSERLAPLFEGLGVAMVVCGHTHMPFDRVIGVTRVVNAGSVGMPFGEPGAYWVLLGPDVQLRRTLYDFGQAAERIRASSYPGAQDFAERSIFRPPSEAEMLTAFGS